MKCFPKKLNNDGFTLIEVMVAVVVLAILTLPLMGYFTNALTNAAKGKSIQKTEMAAQSVLDEINSFNTYDEFKNGVGVYGDGWYPVDLTSDPLAVYYNKELSVDGDNMVAKVKLGFDYEHPVTPSAILYNDYEVPKIKCLYSDASVVAIEDKQTEAAVNHFYYGVHQSATKASIKDAMTRAFNVDILAPDSSSKIIDVKVSFVYTYGGKKYSPSALVDTQISRDDLRHLFILYNAFSSTETSEDVTINAKNFSQVEAQKLNLYFIRQKSIIADVQGNGFCLNLAASSTSNVNLAWPKYYVNGYTCNILVSKNDIVNHEKRRRIAHVTVDLYKQGDSNRLTQVTSSKGE
jgi:prepilin-type N-terminal cleavage/methylation domain-containing protein